MPTNGSQRASRVVDWLRQQVTNGTWPIGTKIPTEPELSSILGVGRSTVREGVRALASLGILETAPGRGTFVRATSPVSTVLTDYLGAQDVADVLGIRRTLEIEAARKAALGVSREHLVRLRAALATEREAIEAGAKTQEPPGPFHLALVAASDNPLLTELYSGLAHVVRLGIRDGRITSSSAADKLRDHTRILQAIEAHDLVEAVHAANDHGDRDLILTAGPVLPPAGHLAATHVATQEPDAEGKVHVGGVTYRRIGGQPHKESKAVRVFSVHER